MRILIAEDDLASRKFLYKLLSKLGEVDVTVDGMEAIEAFMMALDDGEPYDLICLDVMMPKVDGIKVLKTIRSIEKERGIDDIAKIIMTTALNDKENVYDAFEIGCHGYAAKPIDTAKLMEVIERLNILPPK